MAEKQEHRTKLNQRVRIKDAMTHMYPNARAYNEGIVRQQMHDNFGYPLIYVEWDKNHWAYSGEQDRVVLEAHFDPIEEDMSDESKDLRELMEALLERLNGGEEDPRPTEDDYTYDKVLDKAMKDASEGEAYIVIVAAQESHGDTELLVPHIYLHSKSDESALMLEAAIADHVAQTMIRLAQEVGRSKHDGSPGS